MLNTSIHKNQLNWISNQSLFWFECGVEMRIAAWSRINSYWQKTIENRIMKIPLFSNLRVWCINGGREVGWKGKGSIHRLSVYEIQDGK